ncbi:MAG: hypothetical protein H6605_02015 [Flavobacteriales bacterium]|nr:hypothetical protein [Flavobacteriales bacterium]
MPEKEHNAFLIKLPASKSIHNRVLILKHLYDNSLKITNPSDADDVKLMEGILNLSVASEINCKNAGTVLRFLMAYFAAKHNDVTLTGELRMLERPVSDLVNALKILGARIAYTHNEGFPPVHIYPGQLTHGRVELKADVSSQFVTALMLIGPYIGGLKINLRSKPVSYSYIVLTQKLMSELGFEVNLYEQNIDISASKSFKAPEIEIEPDWSSVIFWFLLIRRNPIARVLLAGLKPDSIQGDSILIEWASMLGIKRTFFHDGMLIEQSQIPIMGQTEWDLRNNPDLAPAMVVLLSHARKTARFRGLETLKYKESNRIKALEEGLQKFGVSFREINGIWYLDATNFEQPKQIVINDHGDHRIAMSFACLDAPGHEVKISNPDCIVKSYPSFLKQKEAFLKQIYS